MEGICNERLQETVDAYKKELARLKEDNNGVTFLSIANDAHQGNAKARFIMDQVVSYEAKSWHGAKLLSDIASFSETYQQNPMNTSELKTCSAFYVAPCCKSIWEALQEKLVSVIW